MSTMGRTTRFRSPRGFRAIAVRLAAVVPLGAAGCALVPGWGGADTATYTARSDDGVPIVYDVTNPRSHANGAAGAPLVFIHGWSGDRTYWREQIEPFSADHECIALDLGGHGESGTARAAWTLESLGKDVCAVLDAEGLRGAVLIGHSMGGPVALIAARLRPDRVGAVIGVDTLHDVDRRPDPAAWEEFVEPFRTDFPAACDRFVRPMFRADADPDLVDWVAHDVGRQDPAIALPLLQDLGRFRADGALAALAVPVRCINAEDSGPTNVDGNRRYAADFDAVTVPHAGHLLILEAPEAFNAALRATLAKLPAPPARDAPAQDH